MERPPAYLSSCEGRATGLRWICLQLGVLTVFAVSSGGHRTGLVSVPMRPIVHTDVSPGFMKTFRAAPTPAGLPVAMMSPGPSAMMCET